MRKISNTEENNQYYELVNEYIDEYIIKHKVKPTSLKKYFEDSSRIDSFLKKYKIDDIENVKNIVRDVVEDRCNIEKDGIMKFEKFILEDVGNIIFEESDVNYERILADLYHTSVGHVDVIDQKDHKYNVTDLSKKIDVIIYSKEDVEDFMDSLLPILTKSILSESIDIHKVDVGLKSGKEIKCGISFKLNNITSEETVETHLLKILTEEKVLKIIGSFINDYDILKANREYKYKEEYKGYHIWEMVGKQSTFK